MALEILKDQGVFKGIEGVDDDVIRLLNIDRKELDVRFLGTLSQAQYMQNAQGLMQYLAMTQGAAQADPELTIMIDTKEGYRELAEDMTISPNLIRTSEQMKEIIDLAMKMAQESAPPGVSPTAQLTAPTGG
jgi:hypothetical protein